MFAAARLVVLPLAVLALAALVRACLAVRRNGTDADRVTAFLGLGAAGWIAVEVAAGRVRDGCGLSVSAQRMRA